MIVGTALKLAILGLTAEIFQKNRLQKIWAFFLWCPALSVVLYLMVGGGIGYRETNVYHWIASKVINVNFSLVAAPENNLFVFSVLGATLAALYYNIFYNMEKERLRAGGLYLLLASAMMFLISSDNMLQLLAGACAVDILGFYLIGDMAAKQKYIFFNLLADTALMVVFALIWGYAGSLGLNEIAYYGKSGSSKELAVVLLLFAVMAKSGLVMFHNSFLNLKNINFIRAMFIMTAATPMSGVIILFKTRAILAYFPLVDEIVMFFAVATLLWALWGSLAIDNMQAKIIYFSMMTQALLFGLLVIGKKSFMVVFPEIIVMEILLFVVLMLPVIAASNEKYVSGMGGFAKIIKWSLFVTLLAVFNEIQTVLRLTDRLNAAWMLGFLGVQLLALSHILRQVYLGKSSADDRVWAELKNPRFFYWLPVLVVSGIMIYENFLANWHAAALFGAFILLFFSGFGQWLDKMYEKERIQFSEPFTLLYEVLVVAPVKIVGRILWLMIDFILIERTIINLLNRVTLLLINVFRRLHKDVWVSGFLFSLAGLAAAVLFYYVKELN